MGIGAVIALASYVLMKFVGTNTLRTETQKESKLIHRMCSTVESFRHSFPGVDW
jgi:hypothetical protein